jgi:hypothetical protein
MHRKIVTLHQTLKTALRHGWLDDSPISLNRTVVPQNLPPGVVLTRGIQKALRSDTKARA